MSLEDLKDELKQVKFYYCTEEEFKNHVESLRPIAVEDLVSKYSSIISHAPALYYFLYVKLYVDNVTQRALADELSYSEDYIRRLVKELHSFLLTELDNISTRL